MCLYVIIIDSIFINNANIHMHTGLTWLATGIFVIIVPAVFCLGVYLRPWIVDCYKWCCEQVCIAMQYLLYLFPYVHVACTPGNKCIFFHSDSLNIGIDDQKKQRINQIPLPNMGLAVHW